MRKRNMFAIIVLVLALVLCGCGKKTFQCGLCMKKVTQVPHEATILGQEVELCDSCYDLLR